MAQPRLQVERHRVGAHLQRSQAKRQVVADARELQQSALGEAIDLDAVERRVVDVEQPPAALAHRHLQRHVQPHGIAPHPEVGPSA